MGWVGRELTLTVAGIEQALGPFNLVLQCRAYKPYTTAPIFFFVYYVHYDSTELYVLLLST